VAASLTPPAGSPGRSAAADAPDDIELDLIVEAIYRRWHYDFRGYAEASLRRRLAGAMQRFGCATLSGLQARLLREPVVFTALLDDLTVQVSELFRDPGYYRALRTEVLPHLRTYPSLKVWCAGCSHGEEAYSLAILLREEGLLARSMIYATDINPRALSAAEAGVYDAERMPGFLENHRRSGGSGSLLDHATVAYGRAVFDKTLRKHMVFSDHSLATDSVFAEVHLVSCRNVLIYFDRTLQDRALGLFHDSLIRRGFLGLGSRETLRFSAQADAFEDVSAEHRIYRRRPDA
jgi:chemotaxis protein methyltransferase CheR